MAKRTTSVLQASVSKRKTSLTSRSKYCGGVSYMIEDLSDAPAMFRDRLVMQINLLSVAYDWSVPLRVLGGSVEFFKFLTSIIRYKNSNRSS